MKESIRKIESGDLKAPAFINEEVDEKLEAIPEETITKAKSLLSKDEEEKPNKSNSLLGV